MIDPAPSQSITEPLVGEHIVGEVVGIEEELLLWEQSLQDTPIEMEGEVTDLPPAVKRLPWSLLLAIMLSCVLVLTIIGTILYPLLLGQATIKITPDRKSIEDHLTVTLTANQVFSAREGSATASGPTTGHGHQDATFAHGIVTFFNAALYPQQVPAGTLLIGNSGIHITTDADATIPSGNLASNGQASVQAHVTTIGSGGNIAAADVSGPCCRENILVQNAEFWGGQDVQDYSTVREEDVTGLATQATLQAKEQVIASIQHDIALGQSITPLQCQEAITPSTPVGSAATQVSVTAKENCQAAAYTQATLFPAAEKHFTQTVRTKLGKAYVPNRGEQVSVQSAQVKDDHSILFSLTVKGGAIYHFTSQEIQSMKQAIAEQSQQQAFFLLSKRKGVTLLHMQVSNNWGVLPANIANITITTSQ